jgi:hypothetical protein
MNVKCIIDGCTFYAEHRDKDFKNKFVQHFKERHPEIETLRLGNEKINLKESHS